MMFSTYINGEWKNIHSSKEIIDNILNLENYYQGRIESLKKTNEKLQDEHYKDEQLTILKKERDDALMAARNGFSIPQEKYDKAMEWRQQHEHNQHDVPLEEYAYHGAIGGGYTFSFSPTSIGVFATYTCENCNRKARNVSQGDEKFYQKLLKAYDAFIDISDDFEFH